MIQFKTKEELFEFLDKNIADIKQKVSVGITDMEKCQVVFFVSIVEPWDEKKIEKINSVIQRRN